MWRGLWRDGRVDVGLACRPLTLKAQSKTPDMTLHYTNPQRTNRRRLGPPQARGGADAHAGVAVALPLLALQLEVMGVAVVFFKKKFIRGRRGDVRSCRWLGSSRPDRWRE